MGDEYIKRENAIAIIRSGICTDTEADTSYVVGLIKDIPSADVAPVRHGRWKPFDRTWGRSVFACTVCGDAMDVPTEMGEPIFGYCPNCGARMDEEVKE